MVDLREPRSGADLTMVATLKALLDTGTVSRAADALGVTQPTVSQTLKRMRTYFGDELFVRSGNVTRPTPRVLELTPVIERVMRDLSLITTWSAWPISPNTWCFPNWSPSFPRKRLAAGSRRAESRRNICGRRSNSARWIWPWAPCIHRSIALSVHNYFVAARVVAESDLICTVPNVFMGQKLAAMFPVVLVPMPVKLGSFITRLLWHNRYHADPGHVWLRRTFEASVRKTIKWLPSP